MQQPFRIEPNMPAQDYTTYGFTVLRRHMRPISCADARCLAYLDGWRTTVDVSTDLGAAQARYITGQSGRHFARTWIGTMVTFIFPPGQRCFRADAHQEIDGDPTFYRRDGDWRGNPRGGEPLVHSGPDAWVDDFATHQGKLTRLLEDKE